MQASRLLKANIDGLLRERHLTRHDLAQWCRKSDAWLSKILSDSPTDQARGLPMKYLDRIADFFGVAAYQLFQPGLSGIVGERRKGERRTGKDRRISALNQRVRQTLSEAVASLSQTDVADMIRMKLLTDVSRDQLRDDIKALERSEHPSVRRGPRRPSTEKDGAGDKSGKGRVAKPPETE